MAKARDGLHYWCRSCRTRYTTAWRRARPGYAIRATKKMRRLHPERQAARSKIDAMVKAGTLPSSKTLACADCGGSARHYDHARGYEPPNDLYVEPVCTACHGLRSRKRGEHGRKVECPELDGRQWMEFPLPRIQANQGESE